MLKRILFLIFLTEILTINKPVMIIPGLGGSRIQAKLTNKKSSHA